VDQRKGLPLAVDLVIEPDAVRHTWRRHDGATAREIPPPALMVPLILVYFLAALIVALAPGWSVLSLGPLALLVIGAAAGRASRAPRHPRAEPARA
jgi:hypothetical protein